MARACIGGNSWQSCSELSAKLAVSHGNSLSVLLPLFLLSVFFFFVHSIVDR